MLSCEVRRTLNRRCNPDGALINVSDKQGHGEEGSEDPEMVERSEPGSVQIRLELSERRRMVNNEVCLSDRGRRSSSTVHV